MALDIVPHLQDAIADGLQLDIKYETSAPLVYSPFEGTEMD
jgi:hypothetical protein